MDRAADAHGLWRRPSGSPAKALSPRFSVKGNAHGQLYVAWGAGYDPDLVGRGVDTFVVALVEQVAYLQREVAPVKQGIIGGQIDDRVARQQQQPAVIQARQRARVAADVEGSEAHAQILQRTRAHIVARPDVG